MLCWDIFQSLDRNEAQMSMVPANAAAKDETNPQTVFVFLCHFIYQTCNFIAFREKILETQYQKMSISSFCLQQNPISNVSIRSDEKPFQLILSFVYFFRNNFHFTFLVCVSQPWIHWLCACTREYIYQYFICKSVLLSFQTAPKPSLLLSPSTFSMCIQNSLDRTQNLTVTAVESSLRFRFAPT